MTGQPDGKPAPASSNSRQVGSRPGHFDVEVEATERRTKRPIELLDGEAGADPQR
jgi:hypothetical protein